MAAEDTTQETGPLADYTNPSDAPPGTVIEALTNSETVATPVPLPIAGDARPLTGPDGRQYRAIAAPQQKEMLLAQVGVLETEHFGIVRGFSTVQHSGIVEEGETTAESFRRVLAERLPHVEAELDRLYAELDEVEAAEAAETESKVD